MENDRFTIRFRLRDIICEKRGALSGAARNHFIKDLADRAGLNYRTVLNIYHEKNVRVEVGTLGALAEALGIQPGELFEYKKRQE